MIDIYKINLPDPTAQILIRFIKKGAQCFNLKNTDIYIARFSGKDYFFKGDFNPAIPYMWGIILSSRFYWQTILKNLSIPSEGTFEKQELSILITRNNSFNAIIKRKIVIVGDGKNNLKQLIEKENLRRINQEKIIKTINIDYSANRLRTILKKREKFSLKDNFEYEDISEDLNKKYLEVAKKILNFFSDLPYLSFQMFVNDFKKKEKFCIGRPLPSGGMNVFYPLKMGRKKINTADEIIYSFLTV
jgi:hypothetical protein